MTRCVARRVAHRAALFTALVAAGLSGCGSDTGSTDGAPGWFAGTEAPPIPMKGDTSAPLTLLASRAEINLSQIIEADLGNLRQSYTGKLYLDGFALTEETVLYIDGTLHRYDGGEDKHRLLIKPTYVSAEEGAANSDGYLVVDLKKTRQQLILKQEGAPLGTAAGLFEGQIIATHEVSLETPATEIDEPWAYAIEPSRYGQRPSNVLHMGTRDQRMYIRPAVGLTTLSPRGGCLGSDVTETTLAGQKLEVEAGFVGFPAGERVTVEVRYRVPHYSAESVAGRLWDYAWGLIDDSADEHVLSQTVTAPSDGEVRVSFSDLKVPHPAWGSDAFGMEVEAVAYVTRSRTLPAAQSPELRLMVVEEDARVIVDAFELCPEGDQACLDLRDKDLSDEQASRRRIQTWKATEQGLMDTVTRPIGRCAGGDAVGGPFAESCVAYSEETDGELSARVAAELNFELSVNGRAQGEGSWGGAIDGLGSAEIEGALDAAFSLEVDLKGRFETSRTWRNRSSLDVIYDPSNTQIQWWRVVTPRVRYLELAEYDACGAQVVRHEVYLSDLRDSRLVLACEEVPSFDSVCHAVEPTASNVEACGTLLLAPGSEEARACLGE